jgi:hypothetical protein
MVLERNSSRADLGTLGVGRISIRSDIRLSSISSRSAGLKRS